MTVSDLIIKLKKCPIDARVIMSSDQEGNSFHDVFAVEDLNEVTLWPGHENILW